MSTIIRVENLSKKYHLKSQQSGGGGALRDSLGELLRSPLGGLRRGGQTRDEEFWALKDVSFSIRQGEVVGIVGRNGAGKSTLLKVLSRITEPTAGRVELYGRVGSLLEVGTGFHPELTGRENIFLNGAILGMSRAEIARKFDEIVAFAEISKFIDMPVKHYSSGMYVRLAFAVAAHVEPEILIVDEVLAVGDMTFQRKCLNKMQDAGSQGRTVLFVSHNMPTVARLCERVIFLDEGRVVKDGAAHDVIGEYFGAGGGTTSAERSWPDPSKAPGNEVVRLAGVRVCGEAGETAEVVDIRRPVGVEITYDVLEPGRVLVPNYHFFNEEGLCIFVLHDFDSEWRRRPRPAGRYVTRAWVPGNFLSEGGVLVGVAVTTYLPMKVHLYAQEAVAFRVVDSLDGDSVRGDYAGPYPGVVRPRFEWQTQVLGPGRPASNAGVGAVGL